MYKTAPQKLSFRRSGQPGGVTLTRHVGQCPTWWPCCRT